MKSKLMMFFSLVFIVYPSVAISGSSGGLFLLVVPMDTATEYKGYIDGYFNKNYGIDNDNSPSCLANFGSEKEMMQTSVDIFYLKTKPKEVTDELLSNSLRDKKSVSRLRKILSMYHDKVVENGFDGVLFYQHKNDVINFYTLSALDKRTGIVKSTLPVVNVSNEAKLGQALCTVIAELPTPAP